VEHPSLIVAMTHRGVIGRGGTLPWRLSADLKRFKALTMGHHILMGRKTYESLGRPLPGRTSVVITRRQSFQAPADVFMTHSLEAAIQVAANDDQPFVIGGGEIFRKALPLVSRLYVTWVEADVEGDTFFPPWNPGDWQLALSEVHSADEKNEYDTTFCIYDRLKTEN